MKLGAKDKKFLKAAQDDFPLVSRPYRALAGRYGCSEEAMLGRLRTFKENKIIRYAGAVFNMKRLGIRSTLVAMRVPAHKLTKTVRIINSYPHISHNYLRDDAYNVWFTISAASGGRLAHLVAEIKKRTGIREALDLKTTRLFKSRAVFDW